MAGDRVSVAENAQSERRPRTSSADGSRPDVPRAGRAEVVLLTTHGEIRETVRCAVIRCDLVFRTVSDLDGTAEPVPVRLEVEDSDGGGPVEVRGVARVVTDPCETSEIIRFVVPGAIEPSGGSLVRVSSPEH